MRSTRIKAAYLQTLKILGVCVLLTLGAGQSIAESPNPESTPQKTELRDDITEQKSLGWSGKKSYSEPSPSLRDSLGKDRVQVQTLGSELFKGFLYCTAVFLIAASFYKRFVVGRKDPIAAGIEIISRRSLGSRSALLVVRTEGRRFFLSQAGDEVHLLSALDEPLSFESELQNFSVSEEASISTHKVSANG